MCSSQVITTHYFIEHKSPTFCQGIVNGAVDLQRGQIERWKYLTLSSSANTSSMSFSTSSFITSLGVCIAVDNTGGKWSKHGSAGENQQMEENFYPGIILIPEMYVYVEQVWPGLEGFQADRQILTERQNLLFI